MQVVPKASNLHRSSPALPGTCFLDRLSTTMNTSKWLISYHESPRSHKDTGRQRLPLGPPEGQPSSIRGRGEGASLWGYRGWERKRRNQQGHACVNQAAVQAPYRALSARLNVGQRQSIRFENEVQRRLSASSQPVQCAEQHHLRPDVPRRLSRQPTMPVLSGQCLRTLQIQLNAGRQGGFRLLQGRAIGGDIEIGANRVPLIATTVGHNIAGSPSRPSSSLWFQNTQALYHRWRPRARTAAPCRGQKYDLRRQAACVGRIRLLHPSRDEG